MSQILVHCLGSSPHSLAVMTGGSAKGRISENVGAGAINQHTLPQTKHNQNANFHPVVEREDANWSDRAAV